MGVYSLLDNISSVSVMVERIDRPLPTKKSGMKYFVKNISVKAHYANGN